MMLIGAHTKKRRQQEDFFFVSLSTIKMAIKHLYDIIREILFKCLINCCRGSSYSSSIRRTLLISSLIPFFQLFCRKFSTLVYATFALLTQTPATSETWNVKSNDLWVFRYAEVLASWFIDSPRVKQNSYHYEGVWSEQQISNSWVVFVDNCEILHNVEILLLFWIFFYVERFVSSTIHFHCHRILIDRCFNLFSISIKWWNLFSCIFFPGEDDGVKSELSSLLAQEN